MKCNSFNGKNENDIFSNMTVCGICTPAPKQLPGFSMSCSIKKNNLVPKLANAMIASGWYTRDDSVTKKVGEYEVPTTPETLNDSETSLDNSSIRTPDDIWVI